jgi:CheY-like chemotaxis protein
MKKHFFLIDDDEDELDIFMEAISKINVSSKCTYASNAERAIEILKYLVPDYIFLDINMPKTNGFECLKRIRQNQALQNTCIVMYSNGVDEEIFKKAATEGANACIRKTSSIAALSQAIQNLFYQHKPAKESHRS